MRVSIAQKSACVLKFLTRKLHLLMFHLGERLGRVSLLLCVIRSLVFLF